MVFEGIKKAFRGDEGGDEYIEIDLGRETKKAKVVVRPFILKSFEDAGYCGGSKTTRYEKPVEEFTLSVEHSNGWLMFPGRTNDSHKTYTLHLKYNDNPIGSVQGWRVEDFYYDVLVAHQKCIEGRQDEHDSLLENATE